MPDQVLVLTPHTAVLALLRMLGEASCGRANPDPKQQRVELPLAAFQADAIRRARSIIDERGGVVIADAVGLGKTHIAIGLIDTALLHGSRRVLVTVPAGLRGLWSRELRRLAAVDSVGLFVQGNRRAQERGSQLSDLWMIDSTEARAERRDRAILGLVSHTIIALGRCPVPLEQPDLVVVDEAHAFRNPLTHRYRELARLCRAARVVLLTATPVNNRLLDLYFQLRLFLGDGSLADLGVPDLLAAFRENAPNVDGRIPPALERALASVMVRRTRSAVLGRYGHQPHLRFPRRAPPQIVRYDFEEVWPGFFADVAGCLDSLSLAPLRMDDRGGTTFGAGPELLRFTLLKRLESGLAAFAASITSLGRFLDACAVALDKGRFLTVSDHSGARATDHAQLFLEELVLRPLPRSVPLAALHADVRADLDRISKLRARIEPLIAVDPKAKRLTELLGTTLAGSKAIVFTEFRDTARDLWMRLVDRGHVGLIHGGGAWLGRNRAGRSEVITRFAPGSNHAPAPPAHERVDLLVATDVLSEGFNLQDADTVVSYDLPWNPVRLVQRIGRIDRLGSPHGVVHSYNFLPDRELDAVLGLVARIEAKLSAIRAAIGCEEPVLTDFGLPAFLDRLKRGDESALADIERRQLEAGAVDDRDWIRLEQYRNAQSDSDLPRAPEFSNAAGCRAIACVAETTHVSSQAFLCVVREGPAVHWVLVDGKGRAASDRRLAGLVLLDILESGESSATTPALDWQAASRAVAASDRLLATRHPAPGGVARRTGALLLRQLLALPGGPDAPLCARVDRLLPRLRGGVRAGVERDLLTLLRAADVGREPFVARLRAVETVLAGIANHDAAERTLVAVFELWPRSGD
jgi:superfamily II DNA or RNA helicase